MNSPLKDLELKKIKEINFKENWPFQKYFSQISQENSKYLKKNLIL